MKEIDNIIFDLGGVILNINYELTLEAFGKLSGKEVSQIYTQHQQTSVFDDYETGKTSAEEFRTGVSEVLGLNISDQEFDKAWNAMLLDLPTERLSLIQNLAKDKRVFLLSNTNDIHIEEFLKIYDRATNGTFGTWESLFEKAHYSHILKDRKPHPSIFQTLIDLHNLEPEKTLFIDDTLQHIEGAKKTGLQTHHLKNGDTILDLFPSYIVD
ncbi:HAD family hydrolase [Sediminitomix flava]|uniref:Putative hydrolase of the HAD superfamily n=1 Tax=Sediminitomix flava TaxID=379075 RepID=A0A316A5I9_SEDFL|nr:HAD family phosphatase [Sediminitomix flava]PWJ45037.1 putative hydrolase of the HAD superfamily [Sediminitomix flava]